MELCCHSCHKNYEKDFEKRYNLWEDKIEKLRNTHETDVRNSEWTEYIEPENYEVVKIEKGLQRQSKMC